MQDPVNPTDDELIAWAHHARAPMPMQDWDLIVPALSRVPLFAQLATTPAVTPGKRRFFLGCLYYVIGDVAFHLLPGPAQTSMSAAAWRVVNGLIAQIEATYHDDPTMTRWAERARALLAHPEQFTRDDWWYGGLVNRDAAAEREARKRGSSGVRSRKREAAS